ncbi:hypothetical protein GUJ93_ZPchr0004g39448 [Zizania palustris]|uniref:Uncharacterized protein n=1 Tax=Zizania palustris TaxID=103762 RepID=A0A8J5SQ85_ZIZPA|nr:hypothetical protein GUJ93_ZPchr0004g39448 [Zizania palustris]
MYEFFYWAQSPTTVHFSNPSPEGGSEGASDRGSSPLLPPPRDDTEARPRATIKVVEVLGFDEEMPIHTMGGYLHDRDGFVRELHTLVDFLGFAHEPAFHGIFPDVNEGTYEVTVTTRSSGTHPPFFTTGVGGLTFEVAS